MQVVLVPYFRAGFGHISNARAVEAALRERRTDLDIRLVDLGAEIPVKALRRMYVTSWQSLLSMPMPVNAVLYALNAALPWGFTLANEVVIRRSLPALTALLRRERPAAIMSTHWGCCHVLNRARSAEGLDIPLYYAYTELAGAYHPIRCGADVYFCVTDDAREALVSIGVPRQRIERIGLIVQPDLCGSLPDRQEAQRALGLHEGRCTVLFSLGGEGIGRVFPLLDHYAVHGRNAQILVLTGGNTVLLRRLKDRYPPRDDRAFIAPVGFLESLKAAYAAADILAGKCGAAFATEAIATGKPLLVIHVGAPNEADNRDYMVRHGYAVCAKRPADFTAEIERLAAAARPDARVRERVREATRTTGAADIAGYLLARLEAQERR
jgi:UDP-N-acetylglucosamine:LPS N-acetylglucosamine transferase